MEKGRTVTNIPGAIRTVDCGNGIYELVKEPDVLTIVPVRSRRKFRKLLSVIGTVGTFAGAALAIIFLAPALGTVLFALIAGVMFLAMLSGED